jgi:hypothetical protein
MKQYKVALLGCGTRGTIASRAYKAHPSEFWYVDEYVKALDTNTQPPTNGNLAVHITEIMMGIFESGAYRKRVNLPQQKRDHPLERWAKETNTTIPKTTLNYRDWLEAEDKRLGR